MVSTAVLPTSGQANPTLTAVQLGLRLADDLAAGAACVSLSGQGGRLAFRARARGDGHAAGDARDDRHRDLLPRLRLRLARLAASARRRGSRALAAAFDAGVTWLDLAPLYGGGRAEEIAGRFLKGRRDAVQICSKVGLAPAGGGGLGGLKAALMPAARAAVQAVPALRALLRRSGVQAAKALPLTPELVTGSLETSLRRLGTDHLDLYALHGAPPAALTEPVLRALEDVRAAGKARAVAVASDAAAGLAAIGDRRPLRRGAGWRCRRRARPTRSCPRRGRRASAPSCTRSSGSRAPSRRSRRAPPPTRASGRR